MSLPPLNLLLPHIYTFRDHFTAYPLLITSSTPASLITFLLTYHAAERPGTKSIFIHYGEAVETLKNTAGPFFKSDSVRKGKFLQAADEVQVMQVKTLHELRALLFLITTRSSNVMEKAEDDVEVEKDATEQSMNEQTSVADSEGSSDHEPEMPRPLLAISGMDRVHRDAGELSVQGLSRTLASALEAAGETYHLILHGDEDLDDELALMNDSAYLPDQLASATTTFRKFYARFIVCEWNVRMHSSNGANEGLWRYLNGGGYKVQWEQDNDGQCSNSSIARMQDS